MRPCVFRWLGVAAGLLLLGIPLLGQADVATEMTSTTGASDAPTHLGYPQDWSSRYLVMPGTRIDDLLAAGARDPRHVYNYVMRQVAEENARGWVPWPRRRIKVDWAVSLENGHVPANQFPAKYQFGIGTENCNSDYVLFGLTVSAGTQANLVGINNLYTEAAPKCNSGSPWVAFAYNTVTQTGGQIRTSPALSVDGTKVAFVESTAAGSYFHVLVLPSPIPIPPAQSGTVLSPQTPTSCAKPIMPGCMTTLTIETAATNSNSSPWVDYGSDTVYVGADNGLVYKITPVFGGGAPALVSNADWPVTVSTQSNSVLTAPVVDVKSSRFFLGDGQGYLYAVNLNSPAHAAAAQQTIGWAGHGAGTGIVDPPIVVNDSANPTTNQVFSFTGCSQVLGIGGAVNQIAADFTNATTFTTVDLGSGTGTGDCTTGNVHAGTFDNAFWLNGTTSGHMIACGFVQGSSGTPRIPSNPQIYFFPFASHLITSTGSSTFVVNSTRGDECSPLTEFFDGTTDRFFFGVGNSATGTPDGFLESSAITTSLTTPVCGAAPTASCVKAPAALGGTSGIVIDNQVSNGGANIYFTTLAVGSVNAQKCPSGAPGGSANPYCAVKLTQSGLQ